MIRGLISRATISGTAGRGRKTEPIERIEHGKRLERLLRVDVEADVLVREVQPRPDDRHRLTAPGVSRPRAFIAASVCSTE